MNYLDIDYQLQELPEVPWFQDFNQKRLHLIVLINTGLNMCDFSSSYLNSLYSICLSCQINLNIRPFGGMQHELIFDSVQLLTQKVEYGGHLIEKKNCHNGWDNWDDIFIFLISNLINNKSILDYCIRYHNTQNELKFTYLNQEWGLIVKEIILKFKKSLERIDNNIFIHSSSINSIKMKKILFSKLKEKEETLLKKI